jgi:hypothetical protein
MQQFDIDNLINKTVKKDYNNVYLICLKIKMCH